MRQFLFALMLCLVQVVAAQTILDDAITLSHILDRIDSTNNRDRITIKRGIIIEERYAAVFWKYFPDSLRKTTNIDIFRDHIESVFSNNPFIRVEITDQKFITIENSSQLTIPSGSQAIGFSVANFADGLARFLVKRTKQELSQVFFEDFKKKVSSDPYLRNFCPFTQTQLAIIDSKVYQFNDYIEALREGFAADMSVLPSSTERFLQSDSLCVGCAQKAEGKILIDFLHLAQQMVNGEPPIDMMEYLAIPGSSAIQSANPKDTVLYNIANGLRFLNLISQSLRNPNSNNEVMPWFSVNTVRKEFQDSKLLYIYLGLLWQKAEDINFIIPEKGMISMRSLMSEVYTDVHLTESWHRSVESLAELIHSLQTSLQSCSVTRNVADDFFNYSQSITDLLLSINHTGRIMLGFKEKDIVPIKYIHLMRQCNSLYFNIRQHNYGGAIGNVIYCLNVLKEDNEVDKKKISEMLKYANFMASVAEANSPEEMERAIEFFAVPPGSSQAKKSLCRFSIALNTYTGFAFGWEYLGDDALPNTILSLTAPVGLSLTVGLGKVGSIGTFIPVIDIGAVTAYRFDDKNVSDLPELTWNNILSPGLYAVYDTPGKWPFALGYGAQIGPSLRKVTETRDGTVIETSKSGWRQGFFLSVDIPITYFYLGKGK